MLFVCSRNKWRSLTAENMYKNHVTLEVRSAGTEPSARVKINAKLINWADVIFVMEKIHKQKLLQRFPDQTKNATIIILEIEDRYPFMDAALIDEIQNSIQAYLN